MGSFYRIQTTVLFCPHPVVWFGIDGGGGGGKWEKVNRVVFLVKWAKIFKCNCDVKHSNEFRAKADILFLLIRLIIHCFADRYHIPETPICQRFVHLCVVKKSTHNTAARPYYNTVNFTAVQCYVWGGVGWVGYGCEVWVQSNILPILRCNDRAVCNIKSSCHNESAR